MSIPNFLISKKKNEDNIPSFLKPSVSDSQTYGHISNIGADEPGISNQIHNVPNIFQNTSYNPNSYQDALSKSIGTQAPNVKALDKKYSDFKAPLTTVSNKGGTIKFGNNFDRNSSIAGSATAGLLDSLSLGLVSKGMDKLQPGITAQAQQENPLAFQLGKFAGYISPAKAGTKIAQLGLKGITNPIVNRVAEGMLVGGGLTGIEDKVNGKSNLDTLKDVRNNALLGAGLDLGITGLANISKLPKFLNGLKANAINDRLNPSLEPLKPQSNVNTPKTEIKPIQANLKLQNTPLKTVSADIKKNNTLKIPIENSNDGKSKFVWNSVKNSEVAPKIMKDTIEAPPYVKITNKDTWNNAVKTVEDNPQKSLQDYFNSKELKSANDTALGQALIVKAIKEGRTADANELSIDLAEKLSRAGQTVQAASIFKRLTPEGMLQYANNVVNRVNKVMEKEKGIKDVTKKVNLTTEEANKILEGMKEYQKMPEGDAKNIKLGQIMQIINDKQPSTLTDKIRAVRNISLLGNLKTNVRNVTGNILMGGADNLSNVVGTPIDWLVSKKTGQRAVAMPDLKIQGKGFLKGGKESISDSFGGMALKDLKGLTAKEKANKLLEGFTNPIDRNLSLNAKTENGKKLAFQNKPMRVAENIVNSTLGLGDNTFKTAYKDDILNQLMKGNKVTAPTDEMKAIADQIAKERTYQDTNSVSQLLSGIKNSPQRISNPLVRDGLQIAVDSQLPYVKTPANILKRAIEYTPIGIGEGSAILRKGLKSNTLDMAMQRKAVDRISRGIVGTGIMGLGAVGAKSGLLTGAASKDKDKAAFDKQTGKQPFAVKLGDKYYNYDFAQPLSIPLSAGVQMTQGKKGGLTANNALEAANNALNFYAEQPMLTNIQKLVGSQNGKDFGQRITDAALGIPNQFVPTALKQATQLTDKQVRSNYSPDNITNSLVNPILSKTPFANTLQPKYDTLGRPILQYQGKNNFGNVALNPGNLTTDNSTAVEKMITDVYNQTGDNTIFPRVAPYSITYKNKSIDLTSKEYVDLQKYIGEQTNQQFDTLAHTGSFINNSPENKAKELQKVLNKIYDEGKTIILKGRGIK